MKDTFRVGYGYDVHKLVEGRKLILGGVTIPHDVGLEGHSDADVLLHAIGDALLGSLALGDIGKHFPDTDPAFKNADSRLLLARIYERIKEEGYCVVNIDSTIVAQQPKLSPFIDDMRTNISDDLDLEMNQVSVKATTSEELGFEGRREGISAKAVVLITKNS